MDRIASTEDGSANGEPEPQVELLSGATPDGPEDIAVTMRDDATRIDPGLRSGFRSAPTITPVDEGSVSKPHTPMVRKSAEPHQEKGSDKRLQAPMEDRLRAGDWLGNRYQLVGTEPHHGPLGLGAFGEVWQAHDSRF